MIKEGEINMKKQLKRRILIHAEKTAYIGGKDWDGDIFKYRGKPYVVDISRGIVKEAKDR